MWSIDSCQKRVSANQYQLDRIAGSGIDPSTSSIFCGYPLTSYKFSDDRRLKFNFFKFMSCTNKILISNWPRTRKFSQFLQVGKAFALDVERDQRVTMVSQISILWLVKIWQVSSCGKFMQHLETCFLRKSMIAEADRVLCHLVMFLTVFSTVCTKWNTAAFKILLLFMTGLFIRLLVEKCAACQSHWKSDFGWHSVHFAWCVRGLKSLKRF